MKNKRRKTRNHPTVGPQAEIDRQASGLVSLWLAKGWNLRSLHPDIHVDYIVEPNDSGEPTGSSFLVQQKAHGSVSFSNDFTSERIKAKHICYYALKAKAPVFLFVVDVEKQAGHFLFLQEWIDEHLPKARLHSSKGTIGIKVPEKNRITDSDALRATVEHALRYMREKYPGSLAAAMRSEIASIAAIDPRFDVRLDVINDEKHFTYLAKEPVSFELNLTGESARKMHEGIAYGVPVDGIDNIVSVVGLPLFDKLMKEGARPSFSLGGSNVRQASLEFFCGEKETRQKVRLDGQVTAGTAGLLFRGSADHCPLQAQMKANRSENGVDRVGQMQVKFDFGCWVNRPINDLPYFEEMLSLLTAIKANSLIRHEFRIDGFRFTAGHLGQPPDPAPYSSALALVETLALAREIAIAQKCNPLLPPIESITKLAEKEIQELHSLINGGVYAISAVGISIPVTVECGNEMLVKVESLTWEQGAAIVMPKLRFLLFGTPISVGPAELSLQPAEVVLSAKSEENPTVQIGGHREGVFGYRGKADLKVRLLKPAQC